MKPTRVQIARFPKGVKPAEQIAELEAISKGRKPRFPGTQHLSKRDAKELGETLSLTNRFTLERGAENGPTLPAVFVWDELVKELIRAVHGGKMDIAAIPSPLLREFAALVYRGHLGTLGEIGNAVKRVHARTKGLKPGETLSFQPSNPAKLQAIEQAQLAGTVPTSGATLATSTGKRISERLAREINRALGLKPGKAGRPHKTVGTNAKTKERIRQSDTVEEIEKGSQNFWRKRRRKP